MKFATVYNHNDERSVSFATTNTEESKTQQSDKDDTNINVIVGRFMKTGQVPQVKDNPILGGDFTAGADFRDHLEFIREAKEAFHEIPAKVRMHFNNDPARFIDFASDPENLPQMRKWGLAEAEKPVIITPVPIPPTE